MGYVVGCALRGKARFRPVLWLTLVVSACGASEQGTPGLGEGSSGSASDGSEGDAEEGGSEGSSEAFEPVAATLPRLTRVQYRNAVEDLLGEGLPTLPLEDDTNPYLFYSIGAASTTLSEVGVGRYEESAAAMARTVFDDPQRRAELVGCDPVAQGQPCIDEFIERWGRRAFRRPLDPDERARWSGVVADLGQGDPWRGLRFAVTGMLQSPFFLYRVELGGPDPDHPGRLRLDDWEMASRLAFSLWNTIPDEELLDATEAGELATPEGIEDQARRLLADPRAATAIQDFFGQYFDLKRLEGITRDPERYPVYRPELVDAMRTEVRLLVDDFVSRRDGDIRQIFSTRSTFVNDALAELYGVDAPGAGPITYVPVTLPESGPRAGLLTLGAFLTMNAHQTETSPTLRGKYVRERVLCQTVPPPPDDADVDLDPDTGEGKTLRERLEEHRKNPACAGCHAVIDPPGFLFEHFDPVGAYRETEPNGAAIDASGHLDGTPLEDARGLADLLATDDRIGPCIVTQLYRHAHARLDDEAEAPAFADLDEAFADSGYRFRELLVALVSHESFRLVAAQEGN